MIIYECGNWCPLKVNHITRQSDCRHSTVSVSGIMQVWSACVESPTILIAPWPDTLVGFQPSGTCESVFFGWEALSSRQDLIVSKTFGRWDTFAPLPVGWIWIYALNLILMRFPALRHSCIFNPSIQPGGRVKSWIQPWKINNQWK